MDKTTGRINYSTDNYDFSISVFTSISNTHDLIQKYPHFSHLCQTGCRNYNKKYSCPPLAPSFELISKPYQYMVVHALKVDTAPYKKIYNTVRMINVVEKSIQRKIFDKAFYNNNYPEKIFILENGSCRLCKVCNFQKDLPCKHPDKMRPSLEATGVDVNDLTEKCFNFSLQWYKKGGSFPDYLCTVGGILTNHPDHVISTLQYSLKQSGYTSK